MLIKCLKLLFLVLRFPELFGDFSGYVSKKHRQMFDHWFGTVLLVFQLFAFDFEPCHHAHSSQRLWRHSVLVVKWKTEIEHVRGWTQLYAKSKSIKYVYVYLPNIHMCLHNMCIIYIYLYIYISIEYITCAYFMLLLEVVKVILHLTSKSVIDDIHGDPIEKESKLIPGQRFFPIRFRLQGYGSDYVLLWREDLQTSLSLAMSRGCVFVFPVLCHMFFCWPLYFDFDWRLWWLVFFFGDFGLDWFWLCTVDGWNPAAVGI